ncbi:hypothetical protein [Nocardioides dongkuii]|uniref:hypothetical protein n=1 Tax=Nocardioides dongkuii TaxID=2760089 RepID=UPI0015FAFDE2|nr:hypothetical protein [Nocardioides dongkuii]
MTLRVLRAPRGQDLVLGLVLTAVMIGPLFGGQGFWLFGDMVFVPSQPWKSTWLGLDGQLARAVPMDALVSLLTQVVPGSWVQRCFLGGALLAGSVGAGRLSSEVLGQTAWYARAAGLTVFVWNPWVHERLLMGQWAILAGYLLLPWVAVAALRFRRDLRDGLPWLAVALVLSAVCSPSSGLMAVLTAVVLGVRRRRGHVAVLAALAVVANLPWVVPSLLADTDTVTVDGVFGTFAPRAESAAGVWASLFSLGGTWKSAIVPDERTSVVVVLLSCLVTLAALAGARAAYLRAPGAGIERLVALAAVSFVLAAVPVVPGGASLLESLGERVPGVAVLRDTQRYLAPAALLLVPGIAAAVTWVRGRVRPGREAVWGVVGLLVVAPVLLLPSLAWGGFGTLQRSSYPEEWEQVATLLEEAGPGRSIVLPWRGSYRGFDWNDRRAVLDPAPRFFPGEVLVDDRTFVDDAVVPSEDPRVREVTTALAGPDPAAALRAAGVRWVIVEKGMPAGAVPAGASVHDGPGLSVVDLGEPSRLPADPRVPVGVLLANAAMILLLIGVFADILRRRM